MALIVPIVDERTTLRCAANGNGILLSQCSSACKVFVILPASHGQVIDFSEGMRLHCGSGQLICSACQCGRIFRVGAVSASDGLDFQLNPIHFCSLLQVLTVTNVTYALSLRT